jgi:hypothetical protein
VTAQSCTTISFNTSTQRPVSSSLTLANPYDTPQVVLSGSVGLCNNSSNFTGSVHFETTFSQNGSIYTALEANVTKQQSLLLWNFVSNFLVHAFCQWRWLCGREMRLLSDSILQCPDRIGLHGTNQVFNTTVWPQQNDSASSDTAYSSNTSVSQNASVFMSITLRMMPFCLCHLIRTHIYTY